jgi:hypothetical protein
MGCCNVPDVAYVVFYRLYSERCAVSMVAVAKSPI